MKFISLIEDLLMISRLDLKFRHCFWKLQKNETLVLIRPFADF